MANNGAPAVMFNKHRVQHTVTIQNYMLDQNDNVGSIINKAGLIKSEDTEVE